MYGKSTSGHQPFTVVISEYKRRVALKPLKSYPRLLRMKAHASDLLVSLAVNTNTNSISSHVKLSNFNIWSQACEGLGGFPLKG